MKIPLIRPGMPPAEDIVAIYSSAYATGTHSNFGELFYDSVRFLNKKSGRECLPVNSGTAAIEIACRMRFQKGDKILVPNYTHAGTLQAVAAAGCIPIGCETDPVTWTLMPEIIRKYARKIDGVVAVSPFGYYVNTEALDAECHKHGLPMVYDFAGAWGSFPETINPVCYSLHATKNFSCGEGGIVSVMSRPEWERARWFSNFCNDPDRVVRSLDGRNYKPSELLCAVILAHEKKYQLIENRIKSKKELLRFYASGMQRGYHTQGSHSLCVLDGISDRVATKMIRHGIDMRQYYPPFPGASQREEILMRYALPSDATEKEAEFVLKIYQRYK